MNARKHPPLENPQAPAFSRTAGFRSAIQIWSFTSTEDGELDNTKEPKLEAVICTDWGALKRMRWCPVAPADSVDLFEEGTVHLGLIAGVWSDGKVRILDVSWPKPHADFHETQYLHYSQSAFEISPPHTIPTCLHWLSATSLAVGTAAGIVGIWTLTRDNIFTAPEDDATTRTAGHNPLPWFYKQVADTYILSILSGWPSRPTFMSITTADGFAKLIDLRSPIADTALSGRGRIFSTSQVWHEYTQSFLMSEEAYNFRNSSIRRYFTSIYNMKAQAQISCCASSPVQPGVLIGCADGAVIAGNPVGRALNSKEPAWQQIWFKHEWRQPVDKLLIKVKKADKEVTGVDQQGNDGGEGSQAPTPTDLQNSEPKHRPRWPQPQTKKVPEAVLQQPMVRISEGYRLQATALQAARGNLKGTPKREPIKHLTIYEEPTAVTAVAWNPNLKFGTWAVAGTGSGVLRMEDLGV
jgi:transcription factor C subunit 6